MWTICIRFWIILVIWKELPPHICTSACGEQPSPFTQRIKISIPSILHFGAPKTWYAVPPAHADHLELECRRSFPATADNCANFLRHKSTLLSPTWFASHNVPYSRVTQHAGEIIVTSPRGYHQGYNHGFNCAEASNFATERWIDFGRSSSS